MIKDLTFNRKTIPKTDTIDSPSISNGENGMLGLICVFNQVVAFPSPNIIFWLNSITSVIILFL